MRTFFCNIFLLVALAAFCASDPTVSSTPGAGGSVSFSGSGLTYTLTAEPEDGYEFKCWSIKDPLDDTKYITTNPYSYTCDDTNNESVYAVFVKKADVSQVNGYTDVVFNDATVPSFTLTAMPSNCVSLKCWNTTSKATSLMYVESDGTVVPFFTYGNNALSVDKSDADMGVIQVENTECGYQLTARANQGYAFQQWNDANTDSVREVEHIAGTYTATFVEAPFVVDNTYYATFSSAKTASKTSGNSITLYANATDDIVIVEDDEITIDGNDKILTGDITIEKGGKLTLTGDKTLTASNLYLESEKSKSSQLVGAANLTLSGDAYLDITLEEKVGSKWYAIAVPFTVDGKDGIYVGDVKKVNEKDFRLAEWNGSKRASTGTGFQYPYKGKLEAGNLYMMTIAGDDNVWRFKKDSEAALVSSNTINLEEFASGTAGNAGWNAVANPTLYYADASVETTGKEGYAYIYNNVTSAYETNTLAECSFVVGSPMVVQSGADQTMTFESATQSTLYAPARANTSDRIGYKVMITNGKTTDAMYLTASEDATDSYEIGRDFQKMRNAVPQLWTVAYGEKLAAQDAPMSDEIVYEMGLYAPKAGEYTLSATTQSDANLYLVQDGVTLWNLNESSYTLSLDKGDNTNYSLVMKVSRKLPTAIDQRNAGYKMQKYMKDGQLYIEINNQTYNAQGGIVK